MLLEPCTGFGPHGGIALQDHLCPFGITANQVLGRAIAEYETDSADQDGFSGSGLPAEDAQARVKLQVQLFDDGQTANRQGAQHRRLQVPG